MHLGGNRACRVLALCGLVIAGVAAVDGRAGILDDQADPWGIGLIGTGTRLVVENYSIGRGDTLMDLLVDAGVARPDAEHAIHALADYYSPRTLQIGQQLTVVLDRGADAPEGVALLAIGLSIGNGRHVVAERQGDGFAARRGGERIDIARLAADVAPAPEPVAAPTPDPVLQKLVIGRGDTLAGLLIDAGAEPGEALGLSRALDDAVDVRSLQIGQEVTVLWSDDAQPRLAAVGIEQGADMVTARRDDAGGFAIGGAGALSLAVPGLTAPDATGADTEQNDAAAPPPVPMHRGRLLVETTMSVGRGDTLLGMLRGAGVDANQATEALAALAKLVSPRDLQIGDRVRLRYEPTLDGGVGLLAGVALETETVHVDVARSADGAFDAERDVAVAETPPLPPAAAPKSASSWHLVPPTKPEPGETRALIEQAFEIGPGDTLYRILAGAGVGSTDTEAVSKALRALVNPRRLRVGQEVVVILDPLDFVSGRPRLLGVSVERGGGDFAIAELVDGAFETRKGKTPIEAAMFADVPVPETPAVALASADPDTADVPLPAEPPTALWPSEGRIEMPFVVRKGDTLLTALTGAGVSGRDAKAVVDELKTVFNPRRLRAGQTVTLAFAPSIGAEPARLIGLSVAFEPGKVAEVTRVGESRFRAVERPADVTATLARAAGVIASSLYEAAEEAGVPSEVMNDFVSALSYDVDFQRDLRSGDRFEVLYEVFADTDGNVVRYGSPLYASLEVDGRAHPIYLYAAPGEEPDYFHADGRSVRKALLRTPVNGARVTSSFGKRKDPFQGYTKMHKGVDFGAPKGTPILAAGDGVIEYAGKFSGYGRYVRIRHTGEYKTAYAHMSKFAKGITKGAKVKQGQVIGYVGCTGRCTGNHLHYEVIVHGKQVDPNGVDLPTGRQLDGTELAAFFETRVALDQQFAALAGATQVAEQ